MNLNARTLELDIERLIREVLAAYIADEIVTLRVESARNKQPGRSVTVEPNCTDCASITIYAEDGDEIVYVTIEQNTTLEVPIAGKRYTNFEGPKELAEIIRAIADGKYEETVWLRNSQPVKSVARIALDNQRPIKIKTFVAFLNPFVSLQEVRKKYKAYSQN